MGNSPFSHHRTTMHLVYPHKKISLNDCFLFLLVITVFPREIEDNGYVKFSGVNKVHYGPCENRWWILLFSVISYLPSVHFLYLIFLFFSPVSICLFQSGTRVKIYTPLSYIVREDQALSNPSFFIQPSTQCTSVKNKQNERFYLQCRLFLLHLDVHHNILNYTILKENKIH